MSEGYAEVEGPNDNERTLMESEFTRVFNERVARLTPLKPHASDRRLFRVAGVTRSAVAAFNPSTAENESFSYLTAHFAANDLPVPQIYSYLPSQNFFLEADLGTQTLHDVLVAQRNESDLFPSTVERLFEAALGYLAKFQIVAGSTLNYSKCLVHPSAERQMFTKDVLNFKQQFLSRALPEATFGSLDEECTALCDYVHRVDGDHFLYRDFQSRNIMVNGKDLTFIDYQGGTRGPLQYDVVSLLYQASAKIPLDCRQRLVDVYIGQAAQYTKIDRDKFNDHLRAFVAMRMMQVLGVYGKQGLGAGKEYFRNSIPAALATLTREIGVDGFPIAMPCLLNVATQIQEKEFSEGL